MAVDVAPNENGNNYSKLQCKITQTNAEINDMIDVGICPDCGRKLMNGGNCPFCICGWSKC